MSKTIRNPGKSKEIEKVRMEKYNEEYGTCIRNINLKNLVRNEQEITKKV